MAKLKKVSGKRAGKKTPPAKAKRSTKVSLPTDLNVPSDDLSDYSILLYGEKKIGKTSLASRFPDAFFLSLEPGTKALRVYQRDVNTWEEVEGYIELLEKEDHEFQTVVIDTVDLMYEYAFDYICRKQIIEHPQEENDFGATWRKISSTFRKAVDRLLALNIGVIFISHDQEKEIELRDGSKVDQIRPTMAKQALRVVEALVDLICNYSFDGEKRVLRIDGAQDVQAGCRIEERFLRKGGEPAVAGDRIVTIDMGLSSQESYDNFIRAFNNEQVQVYGHEEPKKKKKLAKTKPTLRRKNG